MPVGKPEVVLDLRARPRLPSRRVGLEDEHVEPLGRGVDRGGEPAGPGPDDHHVANPAVVDRRVQAEALRHGLVGGVLEHDVSAADDDRHVLHADVKAIEESLHVRVAIHVDVRVRVGVAGEELLEPQRAGRVRRADERRVAQAVCDERHAPQDERAHEHFTDLGILLNEPAEPLRAMTRTSPSSTMRRSHERPASREDVHFAGELSGVLDGDELFPRMPGRTISRAPLRTTWIPSAEVPWSKRISPAGTRRCSP